MRDRNDMERHLRETARKGNGFWDRNDPKLKLLGACVYRNGPEWAELPEWTTGMDTDPNTTSHNMIIRIPLAFVRK